MIHALAIIVAVVGFACLCAAMVRHQKDLLGHALTVRSARRLRIAGALSLLFALAVDMIVLGSGYGAVAWCGHLTAGAALVLIGLNRKVARDNHRILRTNVRVSAPHRPPRRYDTDRTTQE